LPQDPNVNRTGNPPSAVPENVSAGSDVCAENPEDVADQDLRTQEADTEVPTPAIVREGWAANTFRSFAVRDFTLFWSGALLSNVGSWMQNAALVIVVYSFAPQQASLFAGISQFAAGVPVFFLSIPAGAIADRFDRRKLLIGVQSVLLLQAVALGLLYNFGVLHAARPLFSLAVVSALGMVAGVFSAFMMPAFQSLLPDLVPRKSLMNAIALNSAQFQSSRMLGPMIVSAMVLAGIGMGWVFLANALSFLFVIAALLAVRARHAPKPSAAEARHREADAEKSQFGQVMAGIEYARSDRAVAMLIVSTAMLTIFGFPYMTLLAAIVHSNLGGSIGQVGRAVSVLMAFNGFGALVGALAVAGLPATIRRDRVIPYTLFAFAVFVICFSLAHSEWAMATFSTLAGAALMATNSLALTSIQSAVPGHLRGRVMALFVMSFVGIMPFSALLFGPLGQAIGPDRAVLGAGVVLLAWAGLLSARPGWLRPRANVSGQ
jgi:MFS family permease